jgi:RNA polymerase sigma-70 factor (ECF subfamily)
LHNTGPSSGNDLELRQWLSRIAEDDQEAFTRVLRLYWNKVYTQALTYLKSTTIAQEVTQDVFVKIWTNRSKLPQVDNFSGYLFIITRNEISSLLRKKQNESVQPNETVEEETWIPDKQLLYKESYAAILRGVELLPPARKTVFKMSRFHGLTYDEIAAELDISRNGVKDHIVKALLFLRNYIRFQSDKLYIIIIILINVTVK